MAKKKAILRHCPFIDKNVLFNQDIDTLRMNSKWKEVESRKHCLEHNCEYYGCIFNQNIPDDFKGKLLNPFMQSKITK